MKSQNRSWLSHAVKKVGEDRRFRHCDVSGAVSHGTARGHGCYQPQSYGKTLKAATSTAILDGLHKKGRWLAFSEYLSNGMTLNVSTKCYGIGVSTAFGWRDRFTCINEARASKLTGIVEGNEVDFVESSKLQRYIYHPSLRNSDSASIAGMSAEQVSLLTSANRCNTTTDASLPSSTAEDVRVVWHPT